MTTTCGSSGDRSGEALLIVRAALDRQISERDRFIAERCTDDEELRRVVDRLLLRADEVELEHLRASASSEGDDPDFMIGTLLGRFRIVERVGRGGMGVVYRAERAGSDFQQTVAIKLIRRGFDFDDVQARFLRERRILSRLSHPNLARFIDGGMTSDGKPWFALEYVSGESIRSWCDSRRLDVRSRVKLFLHVCEAVQYAHSQLVVHRDLKPGNILVDDEGVVRLLDFGISRLLEGDGGESTLTLTGLRFAMTPEYAAPEQFGGEAGIAADLYSLGMILYELVSGVMPYDLDRRDLMEAERCVRTTAPRPLTQAIAHRESAEPDSNARCARRLEARSVSLRAYQSIVRGDLSRILGKTLAKEPEQRYASVEAFAEDLRRWLAGVPVRVSGERLGYRLGKFVKRNRVAVATVTVLSLALFGSLALSSIDARRRLDEVLAERAQTRASMDFLGSLFTDAGPGGEKGIDSTARDILLAGVDRMKADTRLTPQARSELLVIMGESLGSLSALDDAAAAYALAEAEQARFAPTPAEWYRLRLRQAINIHDLGDLDRASDMAGQLLERAGEPGIPLGLIVTTHALRANIELRRANYQAGIENLAPAMHLIETRQSELDVVDIADTRMLHAAIIAGLGRYAQADAELDRALDAYRALDPDHPVIGKTLSMKAVNQHGRGALDQADATFAEAVAVTIKSLGPDNRDLSIIRSNYASMLLVKGEWARSASESRDGLRIHEALGITDPIQQGRDHSRLGRALIELGELAEARISLETAERLARQGEDTPTIESVGFSLSYLDCLQGDRNAWKRLQAAQPPDSASTEVRTRTVYQLAACQERSGLTAEARDEYRRALDIAGTARSPGMVAILVTRIREGMQRTGATGRS